MEWLTPQWPVAHNIRALTTLKRGGYSRGPCKGLNLATHVGDDLLAVQINRRLLNSELRLPQEPYWLTQVHGSAVVPIPSSESLKSYYPEADASISFNPGEVCVVLTADCLPILLCDEKGTRVAAIHAGWRGLAAGVIEAAVERLACLPSSIMAWLGPAIGPDAFEVGEDVVEIFENAHTDINKAFKSINASKWKADIYTLAKLRLEALGIMRIFGGDFCTYTEQDRFYSARRAAQTGSQTGRMATLIWRIS